MVMDCVLPDRDTDTLTVPAANAKTHRYTHTRTVITIDCGVVVLPAAVRARGRDESNERVGRGH